MGRISDNNNKKEKVGQQWSVAPALSRYKSLTVWLEKKTPLHLSLKMSLKAAAFCSDWHKRESHIALNSPQMPRKAASFLFNIVECCKYCMRVEWSLVELSHQPANSAFPSRHITPIKDCWLYQIVRTPTRQTTTTVWTVHSKLNVLRFRT